jgi:antitoxin component of MazEF toxin-antitoxin module
MSAKNSRDNPEEVRRSRRKSGAPKLSLEELLAVITPENLHEETDFGPPVGKEIWWA